MRRRDGREGRCLRQGRRGRTGLDDAVAVLIDAVAALRKSGVTTEYQIHVPRASRLEIHHGGGYVFVADVTGDIEATSRHGDILLMLPGPGPYSIDAKSKFATSPPTLRATPSASTRSVSDSSALARNTVHLT